MNFQCLIGGNWVSAENGQKVAVFNPATGEEIARVPDCGQVETERAIAAAHGGLAAWRNTPPAKRRDLMKGLAARIRESAHEFAALLTREQGKPLAESEIEIKTGLAHIEWFADRALTIGEKRVELNRQGYRGTIRYEPVGVCAAITPWNFPFAMITRKIAPAFAAGCTIILKPAPETPLTALLFAQAVNETGFPPGVFNCLTGDAATIGKCLMDSPRVRKVSFTGSTRTGKVLIEQSARTVKKLTLELGGNAPFIIFDDADLECAIEATRWAKYRNAGQACVGANRFLIQEGIFERFLDRFIKLSGELVIGNGADHKTTIGPLISTRGVDKVADLIEDAIAKGAELKLGAVPVRGTHWAGPVVLTGINESMRIWHEEIFGPVAALRSFRTEEEAINLANDTEYGLAAYIYTEDRRRAERIINSLEAGMICHNDFSLAGPTIPFGGVKQSGYGVEGGEDAIYQYLQTKYLSAATAREDR